VNFEPKSLSAEKIIVNNNSNSTGTTGDDAIVIEGNIDTNTFILSNNISRNNAVQFGSLNTGVNVNTHILSCISNYGTQSNGILFGPTAHVTGDYMEFINNRGGGGQAGVIIQSAATRVYTDIMYVSQDCTGGQLQNIKVETATDLVNKTTSTGIPFIRYLYNRANICTGVITGNTNYTGGGSYLGS
jgi:hypothetical protein